jgi:hypothetical protein
MVEVAEFASAAVHTTEFGVEQFDCTVGILCTVPSCNPSIQATRCQPSAVVE